MMTREDRLYSMRMAELVVVAENLGIKIDRKGAKTKAVEKILAAEEKKAEAVVPEEPQETPEEKKETQEPEIVAEEKKEEPQEEKKEKKERKPRQKKESPDRDRVVGILDQFIQKYGFIKITYEKVGPHFIVLRTEEKGRVKCEFYTGTRELKINMKPEVAENLGIEFTPITKYYLPAVVRIAYTDTAIDSIIEKVLAELAEK